MLGTLGCRVHSSDPSVQAVIVISVKKYHEAVLSRGSHAVAM